MKPIELATQDYLKIYSNAHQLVLDKAPRAEMPVFSTKCFIESFLSFLQAKNYIVRDGQIFESHEELK